MNESVNDIAKKLGAVEFTFKEIFILPDSEKEGVEQLAEKGICIDVELLREHLEYAGKRCCVYESLVEYHEKTIADTQQKIEKDRIGSYALEKWLPILQTHRNIYELMGYDVHELSDFWKNINSILKQIMDIDFAKEIRNNIDAHKNNSFLRQITLYRRCEWVECIIYLSVFTKLIDVIQDYMNLINKNMKNMYEQYTEDVKGFIERLEQIDKGLKE